MHRRLATWLFLSAAIAAPVSAGVEIKQFGRTTEAREIRTPGATIVETPFFTTYELGINTSPPAARDAAPVLPSAVSASTQPVAAAPPVPPVRVTAAAFTADPCRTMDAAEYRDLGSETRALRRYFHPFVRAAECRVGLPAGLLDSLILAESRYRIGAVSPAGAAGLTQLMPGTARDLGVRDRYDPLSSIQAGARYLRSMIDKFGSLHLGVAAYNAGPGSVGRARGIPLNGETPTYVARVLGRWQGQAFASSPLAPATGTPAAAVAPAASPGIQQIRF